MNKYTPSIADIFRNGFEKYNKKYGPLPYEYYKIAHAITNCRTEKLGGHVYQCDKCKHTMILYNSCRNRHCPQCQGMARVQWIKKRIDEVLPVNYFHCVFTLPDTLNEFALRNKKQFYSLLFRSVKETLVELAADKKRLGAHIGFICVLHTWGQTLVDHPHVHVIIPAGGLSLDKKKWKKCKNNFLFPIPVVRKLFKGKFMHYFKNAVTNGLIAFHGNALNKYKDKKLYYHLLNTLYKKKWVVYIKQPFASPESVIKYLGNYTHRIAISNSRILKMENGNVTFSYKDYKENNKRKIMSLSIVEFIRRFMLHVLPDGFMRIRYYGFFANRNRKTLLPLIEKIVNKKKRMSLQNEIIEHFSLNAVNICPQCNKGKLTMIKEIPKLE